MRKLLFALLFVFNILKLGAEQYTFTPINVSDGLSDNQIRYILQLTDKRMVFVTHGNVNLYDGARFTYLHRASGDIYPLNKYEGHHRIYQYKDSLLLVKDWFTLMCIDLRTEKYISGIGKIFRDQGVDEPVDNLFVDSDQRIWLLTGGGLKILGTSFCFDLSSNQGELQDLDTVDDSLYLFYSTGEVICYDIKTKERLYAQAAYPESEQKDFRNTSLIVKGKDGFYQLRNGVKGGFFFYNIKTREWKRIFEKDYTLNTLIIAPDETAYISTIHGIWICYPQIDTHRYMPVLRTKEGEVISTEISTIFQDKQGGIWVGTFNRGLLYYHPSRYKFNHIGRSSFTDSSSGEDISVENFAEDEEGNIYLKSHSKYYRYLPFSRDDNVLKPVMPDGLPEEVKHRFDQPGVQTTFRGKSYTALCTDIRGWVWCGTPDGLRLYKSEDEEDETVFYTENGLSNNFVHAILEDRQHNIWVTTSYGISQIRVDSISERIQFSNFNSHDGTLKGEYMDGAVFEASDGTLYYGGIDGFNVLNPANLALSYFPSAPIFVGLRLRGEEVKAGNKYDGRVILPQTAPFTNGIELSYNQNFLTVEFSALNYQNPAQTRYRYRLDGLDTDWHETSVRRLGKESDVDGILRIPYTNLQPGRYVLKVMASDNSYQWDGAITELVILIYAPWWKTTTAYFIYLSLAILCIFGGVYLYIYTTKRKQERQHKEAILLLRIRSLIEQCNQYEAGLKSGSEVKGLCLSKDNKEEPNLLENEYNAADSAFLTRAMEQVEKNLDIAGYSVEQLSRDLCMERTGLYRKLITLLDESPSIFIRNIRLRRAAQLLLEGELSITEISDRVGFNSPSYMGKCFVEMYGCRPSEYKDKIKN